MQLTKIAPALAICKVWHASQKRPPTLSTCGRHQTWNSCCQHLPKTSNVQSEVKILHVVPGAMPPATWVKGYIQNKVSQNPNHMHNFCTSNCFTLKLSSVQLRCNKALKETLLALTSAAAKNLLVLLQNQCYCALWTHKSMLFTNQTNWPCIEAAETGSSGPHEWRLDDRSKRLRSARMRLSSEIFRDACWNKIYMQRNANTQI